MKRLTCIVALAAVLSALSACSHVDPMNGKVASDLPPGPLKPLPSATATADNECSVLATTRGTTKHTTDGDFLEINFANRTGTTCEVHGYPVLTLRDESGNAVGDHADFRTNGAARYLEMKPWDTAKATVWFPKQTSSCITGSKQLEVIIPDASQRAFVYEDHPYCPGWTVTAIHRGSA